MQCHRIACRLHPARGRGANVPAYRVSFLGNFHQDSHHYYMIAGSLGLVIFDRLTCAKVSTMNKAGQKCDVPSPPLIYTLSTPSVMF